MRGALAELDQRLAPIDPRALAVLLVDTLRLWRVADEIEHTMKFYVEALAEFPLDIVDEALRRVRLDHAYPTAPKPADFRKQAIALAAPLRGAQSRARLALHRYRVAARAPALRRPSAVDAL